MTNLIVRRTRCQPPRSPLEGDPFHWMHRDPLHLMIPLFRNGKKQPAHFTPDFEIKETQDGFVFKADLPGIEEKDLEITVTGNHLTVSGRREAETEENTDIYFARECSYGTFTRTFTLPEGIDGTGHIRAELRHGVMTLLLPKSPERQRRRVKVKVMDKPTS